MEAEVPKILKNTEAGNNSIISSILKVIEMKDTLIKNTMKEIIMVIINMIIMRNVCKCPRHQGLEKRHYILDYLQKDSSHSILVPIKTMAMVLIMETTILEHKDKVFFFNMDKAS